MKKQLSTVLISYLLINFSLHFTSHSQTISLQAIATRISHNDTNCGIGFGETAKHIANVTIRIPDTDIEASSNCIQCVGSNTCNSDGNFANTYTQYLDYINKQLYIDLFAFENDLGATCTYETGDGCLTNSEKFYSLNNLTPRESSFSTIYGTMSYPYNRTVKYELNYKFYGTSINNSVDNQETTFTTSGTPFWGNRGSWSYDSEDCAASGTISHNSFSAMSTIVSCKESVSFKWKVSSQLEKDFLSFSINGIEQDAISGITDWVEVSYALDPAKENVLEWKYATDASGLSGLNRGFIDQITFSEKVNNEADLIIPSNEWIVASYNTADLSLATSTYQGFYSQSALNINTLNDWDKVSSPSTAANYNGCIVQPADHTLVFKRTGIICGNYQLDLAEYYGPTALYINSQLVYETTACCTAESAVWSGQITEDDVLEIRTISGNVNSGLSLDFVALSTTLDAGSINDNQLICNGTSPSELLSVSDAQDDYPFDYVWQFSEDENNWITIDSANRNNYLPITLSNNTHFRRVAYNQCADSVRSNQVLIEIAAPLTAGTIAGTQSLCTNETPTAFSSTTAASGDINVTYQWQYSLDEQNWDPINGANEESYLAETVEQNTFYRRLAIGACSGTLASNTLSISIPDSLIAGSIDASESLICANASPVQLNSVTAASGGENLMYEWQSSTDSITWATLENSNTANYSPTSLSESTYFRRKVMNACQEIDFSNPLLITIVNPLSAGSVAGSQAICTNQSLEPFTSTEAAGGDISFTYQWQYSFDEQNWVAINAANQAEYLAETVEQNTFYRRLAIGVCSGTVASNTLSISIPESLIAGSIDASESLICANASPVQLNSVTAASGGENLMYEWQSSTDSITWATLENSNTANYSPTSLSESTYFRRKVMNACQEIDFSNPLLITIANPLSAGTVAGSQAICTNQSLEPFTSTEAAGGDISFTYQWQYSFDEQNWVAINAANQAEYLAETVEQNTFYRRLAIGACSGTVASNTLSISIPESLIAGSIDASESLICANASPVQLNSVSAASGGENLMYEWQSSTDSITWATLENSNTANYSPTSLSESTYFRRKVINACQEIDFSNPLLITIANPLSAGTVAGSQAICTNQSLEPFTSTEAAGGDISFTYQWQYSFDEQNWVAINAANQAEYLAETVEQNTFYRRLAIGACSGTVASNTLSISIPDSLIAGSIDASESLICANASTVQLNTVTPAGGGENLTYEWQSSTDSITWVGIENSNSASYTLSSLSESTYFRRAVTNTCGESAWSNSLIIEVAQEIKAGTISGDQEVCDFSELQALESIIAASGGLNSHYIWESSSNEAQWVAIENSNQTSLVIDSLIESSYFRRLAISECADTAVSNSVYVALSDLSTEIVLEDNNLIATANDVSYQWLNCSTEQLISGATSQTFTPSETGSFAVVISTNNCQYTSECVVIENVLSSTAFSEEKLIVYPNPTKKSVYIKFDANYKQLTLNIYNTKGVLINQYKLENSKDFNFDLTGDEGIYFLEILTPEGKSEFSKLIKY